MSAGVLGTKALHSEIKYPNCQIGLLYMISPQLSNTQLSTLTLRLWYKIFSSHRLLKVRHACHLDTRERGSIEVRVVKSIVTTKPPETVNAAWVQPEGMYIALSDEVQNITPHSRSRAIRLIFATCPFSVAINDRFFLVGGYINRIFYLTERSSASANP
jgi:hypothetical protein